LSQLQADIKTTESDYGMFQSDLVVQQHLLQLINLLFLDKSVFFQGEAVKGKKSYLENILKS
jgi:hypothetical protein